MLATRKADVTQVFH